MNDRRIARVLMTLGWVSVFAASVQAQTPAVPSQAVPASVPVSMSAQPLVPKKSSAPALKKARHRRPHFTLRLSPGVLDTDPAAFHGDAAAYDELALLTGGIAGRTSGPPDAGFHLALEPCWRPSPRFEMGIELGAIGWAEYGMGILQPRPLDLVSPASAFESMKVTATPLGLNLRWYFHLGKRTDFYLLTGAATYPVKIAYHREGINLPALLHPENPGVYEPYDLQIDGEFTASHSGVHLGVGTDLSIGKRWILNPCLRWRWARVTDFRGNATYTSTGGSDPGSWTFPSRLWHEKDSGLITSLPAALNPDNQWAPMPWSLNGLEVGLSLGFGF